ncbi:DNA polymerase Y family protein [Streptomyces cuspidosporus]|uniref:UmuC domain-containing protein n=1 Tax=Streptomyces cuspidosporus TaxID=66882 RepID=A0ABN3GDR8_9ACTN
MTPRQTPPARSGEQPHVLYVRFHPVEYSAGHSAERAAEAPSGAPRTGPGPGRAPGAGPGPGIDADTYEGLLALLTEVTPVVEAIPPDAALADVAGALRYFDRDAAGLAEIVRVRALARYGVDCSVGVAANPLLARMAAAQDARSAVRTVSGDPDAVAAFLADKPPTALPGVGQATARALHSYGLDSAARIAAVPLPTLRRILGPATARRVHDWARGIDPVPVTPNAPARSMGAEHRFGHDELDPERRCRALLTLADRLGSRLRTSGQVARVLTLTVRYADRSTTTRSRTLPEPTAHTPTLTATAYALHAALGLQRARVRSLALRAEGLTAADQASHQLTFDPADDKARRIEAAVDRARARFGDRAVRPAGGFDTW